MNAVEACKITVNLQQELSRIATERSGNAVTMLLRLHLHENIRFFLQTHGTLDNFTTLCSVTEVLCAEMFAKHSAKYRERTAYNVVLYMFI